MAENSKLVEQLKRRKIFFEKFNDLQSVHPNLCYECFDEIQDTLNREMGTDYTLDEIRDYLDREQEEVEYKYLKMGV